MPTRKQKRREAKSKRHEYEFVYVDDEGNEVEAPPAEEPKSRNGSKPAATAASKKQPRRSGRARTPQPPSWRRAAKRSSLIGLFLLVFVGLTSKGHVLGVLPVAIGFSLLYIPAMYYMDRAFYRRWQQRQQQPATKKR